jgi:acyl dehydratase
VERVVTERKKLNYDLIMSSPPRVDAFPWTPRQTVTYNLGIGFGDAAIRDERYLDYVVEETLKAFPTMVCVLGIVRPSGFNPDFNIDFPGILHGEEEIELFRPLAVEGDYVSTGTFDGVWDKGPEKGAVMRSSRFLSSADGDQIAKSSTVMVLRNNGGFGGSNEGAPQASPTPDRAPDGYRDMPTRPEQALLYRLSGDMNPLHSHPEVARAAGFPRPILMGLCSFATAGRALSEVFAEGDGSRLRKLKNRFSGVVYPGETIRVEYWDLGAGEVAYRARVLERESQVLAGGRAFFAT